MEWKNLLTKCCNLTGLSQSEKGSNDKKNTKCGSYIVLSWQPCFPLKNLHQKQFVLTMGTFFLLCWGHFIVSRSELPMAAPNTFMKCHYTSFNDFILPDQPLVVCISILLNPKNEKPKKWVLLLIHTILSPHLHDLSHNYMHISLVNFFIQIIQLLELRTFS